MKLLLLVLLTELLLLAWARPSSDVRETESLSASAILLGSPESRSDSSNNDTTSDAPPISSASAGKGSSADTVDGIRKPIRADHGFRTATNADGSRMSFAEAIGLIANRTRLINDNIGGLRKAYNESGILGAADYLAALPDTLGERPVIGFYNVTVNKNGSTPVVTASLNQVLPVNGPPFVFNLSDVLLEILGGILETRVVKDEQGQDIRIVVAHNPSNVLLNIV